MNDKIVITGLARTPMGGFQGVLSDATAPELGAAAIKSAVERSGLIGDDIDEVIMGCVLPAGLGQAPARQASLGAGLPLSTGCTTINKMCGSGMKATMFANDLIRAGSNRIMIAGGLGNVRKEHVLKENFPDSTPIVVLGGPAMLIGLGGGAASSM